MIFRTLFCRSQWDEAAEVLYSLAVAQARHPVFYTRLGVADTVDGRFDMVVLHAFLLLHRLGTEPDTTAALAQALFDVMLEDMDRSLREMGVSDLQVGRKVKVMAQAFYGRAAAYDAAVQATEGRLLQAALERNVYRGTPPTQEGSLDILATYVRAAVVALAMQSFTELLAGRVLFGPPPEAIPDSHA